MKARGTRGRGLALGILVAAAAVSAWAGPPPDRKPVGIGDVYLSFGGYMADGDNASDPDTTAYPAVLLKNHLEPAAGKAIQLVDLGTDEGSQDTVAKFIGDYRTNASSESSLAKVMQALREAKAQGQRVSPITVELGGEDVLNSLEEGPAAIAQSLTLLRDQLAFILDELTDAASDADGRRTGDIVLVTYYNPLPDIPEVGAVVGEMNGLIRKMARTRGLAVADIDRAFAGKEAQLLDGLSPNDEGHVVIAAEIWKAAGYVAPTAGN
jgi:hypothetical protein